MLAAPKIRELTGAFDRLIADLKKEHRLLGSTEYSAEQFAWLRPDTVQDLSDEQICEPYPLAELQADGERYMDGGRTSPTRGDYALLDYQTSLLQSFARAFNERHTSKLRHFSHSAGISDIISKDKVGVIDGLKIHAVSLLEANSLPADG